MSPMAMVSKVAVQFEWNDWYRKIAEFASTLIDDAEATVRAATSIDGHIVFKYVLQEDLPSFIQDNLYPAVQHLQVFCVQAGRCGMIHTDGIGRKCGLNIPLRTCERGIMEWYDQEFTPVPAAHTAVVTVTKEELNMRPLSWPEPGYNRMTVEKPTLIRTSVWHRLDNRENPYNRFMASIRFKDNPEFEYIEDHLTP